MADITGYELSRRWFDFCFSNPEKITPTHTALYFFAVEHCNRLGWKRKFGLPTEMAKDALGIKSWHTYIKVFNDIVSFGFFDLIEKSKNQYSSNIIALIKNDEALDKALDEATSKHLTKQLQSTYLSYDSIDKLITNKLRLITENIDLISENLEKWVKAELSKPKIDSEVRSSQFEKFWDYYKKGSKKVAKERFMKLSEADIEIIRVHLPAYFKAHPDKKFRKDAERYLSNRLWENDDVKELAQKLELPKNWFNIDLEPKYWALLNPEQVKRKKLQDARRSMGV